MAEDVAGEPPRGRERILLAEDDPLVREHAASQLAGLGYAVTAAESGPDALKVLEGGAPFDLLFTDVVMPGGMSGAELAREARRMRPGIRVLFTSGYAENAIVHDGRLDDGVQLLSKPYRLEQLARKVRETLDAPEGGARPWDAAPPVATPRGKH
jgi:CheY-like chemotaxis protein